MDWIFDGIGTMLIGLVVGAGAGSVVTWRITVKRLTQKQISGDRSRQIQAGRDVREVK